MAQQSNGRQRGGSLEEVNGESGGKEKTGERGDRNIDCQRV